jgi:type IV pilus assembly protein PilP
MIPKSKPLLAVVMCGVFTSGCVWVEDTQDLASFVADVQSKPRGTIEPLPTFEPYHSFVYQGASLRDPFVPLVKIESALDIEYDDSEGVEPDQNRPRSYLEQFSVDDLKMVGTIGKTDDKRFWSLILDSNGEIHRVSKGDYIGLDFGKVVAVNEQRLDVVEIISNGRGGWMQRPRTLELVEQE